MPTSGSPGYAPARRERVCGWRFQRGPGAVTGDTPQGPGSAVHHRASRRDPPGRRSSFASRPGLPTARSTCFISSNRYGRTTTVHVERSTSRAWARGEITWAEARTAAGHANAAARDLRGAARHAAYAAGQAAAVGHVAAHELGAAAYAIMAAPAAATEEDSAPAGRLECQLQRGP